MKFCIYIYCLFFWIYGFAQLPEGFVYANDVIPDIDVELRYYSSNNFVGTVINGYNANKLILTKQTAETLKKVQNYLQQQNLCLKVYDGYRPQRAVDHFIVWARDINDTLNKHIFYPNVKKKDLFKEEYIASKSGHSRGSTIDITIIDGNTSLPIDMGSTYDFFGKESWVNFTNISEDQKANRQLLQSVMLKFGFRNYPKEWWHFTLKGEPFPNTYFNFSIE
jgi:D-alanyl-D-alanine dipeptidase